MIWKTLFVRRLVLLAIAGAMSSLAPAGATGETVEIPVAFEVTNENKSVTRCPTDGGTYTVRGTLTAPSAGVGDSVTLYIHGSGDASSWNLQAFPEYDYLAAMARLGHTSVFIHSLGYGPSDPVDGTQVCFGSYATMVDQVIGQLREGSYDAGEEATPAFERVALAGHSGGGIMVELYSVSFDSIDALAVVGWADSPSMARSFYTSVVERIGLECAKGGHSKQAGGPGGWSVPPTDEFIHEHSYNVTQEILDELRRTWEGDACGLAADVGHTLAANIALAPAVDVPVLLLYGDHDPFLGAQLDIQRARYIGSDDVTLGILPDTGHMMMVGNTLATVVQTMSGWLRPRGF